MGIYIFKVASSFSFAGCLLILNTKINQYSAISVYCLLKCNLCYDLKLGNHEHLNWLILVGYKLL